MRKRVLVTFFMAFTAMAFIHAQDLEKVLDNHFKAIGQKKLLKIETLQATGKAAMMGMDNSFQMINKRPDKVQISIDFQGAKFLQVYDGETAWTINPMMGPDPVVVTGAEANSAIEASDMDGQLWKYKEKGHQLELEGIEDLEGKEVYVLKLTKKSGTIDHYYLGKDDYLLKKVVSRVMANGMEMEVEVLLSDYRDVEGYMMPFNTLQKVGGQTNMNLTFDEVKVNLEVDDSIFSMPGSK